MYSAYAPPVRWMSSAILKSCAHGSHTSLLLIKALGGGWDTSQMPQLYSTP
jgi:hypothetical protein